MIHQPGDLETRQRPGTSCKIEIISGLKLLNISLTVLDLYLKFVPDIQYSFPCARHRHKVSSSFTNESGCDN